MEYILDIIQIVFVVCVFFFKKVVFRGNALLFGYKFKKIIIEMILQGRKYRKFRFT